MFHFQRLSSPAFGDLLDLFALIGFCGLGIIFGFGVGDFFLVVGVDCFDESRVMVPPPVRVSVDDDVVFPRDVIEGLDFVFRDFGAGFVLFSFFTAFGDGLCIGSPEELPRPNIRSNNEGLLC